MNAPAKAPPGKKHRSRWLSSANLERVVVFSIVSIAGALLWTSVSRLVRVRTESRDLSRRIALLTGDIDVMRAQWPGTRTQQVSSRLSAAEASLFQGPPAVAEWIESVRANAIPLALETDFEFVGARTQALDRTIAVMQTRLHIAPSRGAQSPRTAYHRLLELGHAIAQHPQRLDVLELNISGTSNSVGEASALIEVWSDTPTPATP
jgi:hypothetical protein